MTQEECACALWIEARVGVVEGVCEACLNQHNPSECGLCDSCYGISGGDKRGHDPYECEECPRPVLYKPPKVYRKLTREEMGK